MMEPKRVCALYRVSTAGQVEKDDIPMQKQECREFADSMGWKIVKEYFEKGVSGYKVSAKNRDAIQSIQQDALRGAFDILLVFMFDRLGRRDDETPFVVEWFVKNGIEVWSTREGQQRFDTHVDKLMNYIRYWQASGESLKTSIRTKTRLEQLTEQGHYTGGSVPFGYRIEKQGRVNKRNHEVCELVVDEQEAEIVRLIFHKYVDEGYGAQRLSHWLDDQGIRGRQGKDFPNTSINRMIKNETYTGIIINGEARSELLPELQIIPPELFQRAQQIMQDRTKPHSPTPLNCKSRALVVGCIYCGHCGNRLTLTTAGRKRKHTDGSYYYQSIARYQCHYKVRHKSQCDGQSGYTVSILDKIVDEAIRTKFAQIKAAPKGNLLGAQHEKQLALANSKVAQAKARYSQKAKELSDLRAETLKVIRGESKLSAELLNSLVAETEAQVASEEQNLQKAQKEQQELLTSNTAAEREYNQILSWAGLYDQASFDAKKMIVSQLIHAVYVRRDYEVEIDFNISFDEELWQ